MPLRVLDGNQTATTLSSVVTGGEHIVAHTVVSLGATAIANITSAVSGSVVSISNFPSTQTVAGTVTALLSESLLYPNGATGLTKGMAVGFLESQSANPPEFTIPNTDGSRPFPVAIVLNDGAEYANGVGNGDNSKFLPISGTVTVGNSITIGSCVTHGVTVANSVTIASLPAISGAVTARLQDASGNNLTSTSIGGVQRLNVSLASAATPGGTLPTFVNVYGGSDSGTVRALTVDSSGRTVVTVSNFPATQAVSLASTTVTVSALPSGALTTRFGSVTTANTAQITSAVTNTSRKYLLAQNISAGTVTIGIGFSPTTTQGIQLTAGAGLTFDAFCPTGAVYWLGAVTGAAFTILEG